jgi:hypothetical protein
MTPRQLAAGERWARRYRRRHPPAHTEHDRQVDFAIAEQADENERDRRR